MENRQSLQARKQSCLCFFFPSQVLLHFFFLPTYKWTTCYISKKTRKWTAVSFIWLRPISASLLQTGWLFCFGFITLNHYKWACWNLLAFSSLNDVSSGWSKRRRRTFFPSLLKQIHFSPWGHIYVDISLRMPGAAGLDGIKVTSLIVHLYCWAPPGLRPSEQEVGSQLNNGDKFTQTRHPSVPHTVRAFFSFSSKPGSPEEKERKFTVTPCSATMSYTATTRGTVLCRVEVQVQETWLLVSYGSVEWLEGKLFVG